MNSKKISIAQAILSLNNAELLNELENLLKTRNVEIRSVELNRKSIENLQSEINQSIQDCNEGNFVKAENLLNEISNW